MKYISVLLLLCGIYLGFGQPDVAGTFVRSYHQIALDRQFCEMRDTGRIIQISTDELSRPSDFGEDDPIFRLRKRISLLAHAAHMTWVLSTTGDASEEGGTDASSREIRAVHLPTFFMPDHIHGESFLSLTGEDKEYFQSLRRLSAPSALLDPPVLDAPVVQKSPAPKAVSSLKGTLDGLAAAKKPEKTAEDQPAAKKKLSETKPQPAKALINEAARVSPSLSASAPVRRKPHAKVAALTLPAKQDAPILDATVVYKPGIFPQAIAKKTIQKKTQTENFDIPLGVYPSVVVKNPFRLVPSNKVAGAQSVVRFAGAGRFAIAASSDGKIRLWNLAQGELERTFSGHSNLIWSADVSHDGSKLLTAARDGLVKLWNVHTGTELLSFKAHRAETYAVALAPDGRSFLTADGNGSIRHWNASDGKLMQKLAGHRKLVRALEFSNDGTKALSGGADRQVKVWDLSSGELLSTHKGHVHPVLAVAFLAQMNGFVSGAGDNTVKIWSMDKIKPLATMVGHGNMVRAVAVSPAGQILSADGRGELRVWDSADGRELARFSAGKASIMSVAFSPDGRTILTGSRDGALKLWRVADHKLVLTILPFADESYVAVRPEGPFSGPKAALSNLSLKIGGDLMPLNKRYIRTYHRPNGLSRMRTARQ